MYNNNIIEECDFREITIRKLIALVFITSTIGIIPFIFQDGKLLPLICSQILLILTLLWCFKVNKTNIPLLFKDFKNKLNIKEICFLLFFALFFAITAVILVPSLIAVFNSNLATKFMSTSNDLFNITDNTFIIYMLAVISGPILEELIFRAIIFKRLSIHINVFWGVLLSSIFFALQHPASSMLGTFMLAVVNCLLYIKYKNILLPILLHSLNNFVALSSPPMPFLDNINFKYISSSALVICLLASIILITILLILFLGFYKKNKDIFATSSFKHE